MARTKKGVSGPEETSKENDVTMEDAPTSAAGSPPDQEQYGQEADGEQAFDPPDDVEEAKQRVRMLPGSTEHAASFEFIEEGHTLGNALRPEVEFCAYAIPHPSEPKMNLRIQTYGSMTAEQALDKGLKDLEDLCDVVSEKFWGARNEYMGTDETWEPPRDLRMAQDTNEAT